MWDFDCPHILELIRLWKKEKASECCGDDINEHLNCSAFAGRLLWKSTYLKEHT